MKAGIDPRIDGRKVEELRWRNGLTGTELARRAHISRQHCVRIRHAGYDASLAVQARLANALGVPVEDIQQSAA
jgi:DNA-binding XRE family transcriptional regulator